MNKSETKWETDEEREPHEVRQVIFKITSSKTYYEITAQNLNLHLNTFL